MNGLKDELRIMVIMFKPQSLSVAFGLARLQEEKVWRRNQPIRYTNTIPSSFLAMAKTSNLKLPSPNPLLKLPELFSNQKTNLYHTKKSPYPI